MDYKIAIIGKPNVGKSTLFNRLCKRRLAITHDKAGVTRDSKINTGFLGQLEFSVIDTPGLDKSKNELEKKMFNSSFNSAVNANLILFVVDGKNGINSEDFEHINQIRQISKPLILVVNKVENPKNIDYNQIYKLGFDQVAFISSEHNLGFDQLENCIQPFFKDFVSSNKIATDPKEQMDIESNKLINVSIIGRPNAGKSTLFNKLLGFDAVIVSDVSGTTRDSITYKTIFEDHEIQLIDTAGLRRKATIIDQVEELATAETINAIRRSHIVMLIIDATHPFEKQDLSILRIAINEGKGVSIIINKFDLINNQTAYKLDIEEYISEKLFEIKGLTISYISALKNKNFNKIWHSVVKLANVFNKNISTGFLNRVLVRAISDHIPPLANNGRRIRPKYITQTAKRPPTFTIFGNMVDQLPQSYERYVYNAIREAFELYGVPIRLNFKNNNNPYQS